MAAKLHLIFNKLFHCLLSLRLVLLVDSKFIEGILETPENWAFLSRFCFLPRGGRYEYWFEYPSEYRVQNLLLYYDEPHQWRAVYKTATSCQVKEAVLNVRNNSQVVNLTKVENRTYYNPGCREIDRMSDGTFSYECNASWTFKSMRSRWWYMAISNCHSERGLYLKYKILMYNGNLNDHWFGHFSADEFYIIHNLLVFFILYVLLLSLSIYAAYGLRERGLLHTTFKLYLASVISQTIGLMFLFISYNEYAKDGQGIPPLKTLGQIFQAINSLLFIYLILLLGKGYTITRARLSLKSSSRLTIFMSSYCICYVILFVFEMVVFDPGEVLYLYESPGGYGLLILKVIGWFMLLYAVGFTLKHHPHKLPFYVPFLLFYSLWFISGPILILIITYVIDNWVRETVSVGLDLSVSFLGHAFFLNLTWPTSANNNFPFHIKTTQVRALQRFGSINGSTDPLSLDNFTRHPYEAPPIKVNQRINDVLISREVALQEFVPQLASRRESQVVTIHNLPNPLTPVTGLTEPVSTVKTS